MFEESDRKKCTYAQIPIKKQPVTEVKCVFSLTEIIQNKKLSKWFMFILLINYNQATLNCKMLALLISLGYSRL